MSLSKRQQVSTQNKIPISQDEWDNLFRKTDENSASIPASNLHCWRIIEGCVFCLRYYVLGGGEIRCWECPLRIMLGKRCFEYFNPDIKLYQEKMEWWKENDNAARAKLKQFRKLCRERFVVVNQNPNKRNPNDPE